MVRQAASVYGVQCLGHHSTKEPQPDRECSACIVAIPSRWAQIEPRGVASRRGVNTPVEQEIRAVERVGAHARAVQAAFGDAGSVGQRQP